MHYKDLLNFRTPLGRSFILHIVLFTAILLNISLADPKPRKLMIPMQAQMDPIQAVAISEEELKEELARLKNIDNSKKAAEQKKLAEQQRVKQEQEKLKKQEAEKKRLAEVQKKQDEAKKLLAAEQKRKADEAAKQRIAQEQANKAKQPEPPKPAQAKAPAPPKETPEQIAAKKKAEVDRQALLAAQQAAQAAQNQIILREVDRYKLMVQQAIMRHWMIQGTPDKTATTRLSVRLSPNGTVLSVQLQKSSGNVALDRSAIAAVHKASPLPVPTDPEVFKSFRELTLILRPDSIISEG